MFQSSVLLEKILYAHVINKNLVENFYTSALGMANVTVALFNVLKTVIFHRSTERKWI